jgi:hypothetical protein
MLSSALVTACSIQPARGSVKPRCPVETARFMLPLHGIRWGSEMTSEPSFMLRRIIWPDGQPSLDPEDYSVREDDRDVGRIYRTTGGARGSGYAWFVYGTSRARFAATLDDAKTQWKTAYARVRRRKWASVLPTPDSIPAVTITNNVYSEVRLHRTRQHLRAHVSAGRIGSCGVPKS